MSLVLWGLGLPAGAGGQGGGDEPRPSAPLEGRCKFRGWTVFFLLELEIQIPAGPRVVLVSFTLNHH